MDMFATNVTKISSMTRLFLIFLVVVGLFLIFTGQGMAELEEEGVVGIEIVAILNTDEHGMKLRYPSSVAYDKDMDETYVMLKGVSLS